MFELLVQLRVARDKRGGRRRRTPSTQRGDARFDDDRIAREAEVIIVGKVDTRIVRRTRDEFPTERGPLAFA